MKPKFGSRKWVFRGRKFDVALERFRYRGTMLPREIIRHPGSVVILPRLSDGRFVLIRQFRYPCRKMLWEFPAGTRDRLGARLESALRCARREIREEIGSSALVWRRLGAFYLAPGTSTEWMEVYLAERLKKNPLAADADEIITSRAFPLTEILRMCRSGTICDAKTIAAIQLLTCGK